jgi:hypothetical protein
VIDATLRDGTKPGRTVRNLLQWAIHACVSVPSSLGEQEGGVQASTTESATTEALALRVVALTV